MLHVFKFYFNFFSNFCFRFTTFDFLALALKLSLLRRLTSIWYMASSSSTRQRWTTPRRKRRTSCRQWKVRVLHWCMFFVCFWVSTTLDARLVELLLIAFSPLIHSHSTRKVSGRIDHWNRGIQEGLAEACRDAGEESFTNLGTNWSGESGLSAVYRDRITFIIFIIIAYL